MPKAIVSGDFYWQANTGDRFLIAASDCTGHGVSGAFMSLIGSTLLNKIVLDKGIVEPDVILSEIDKEISVSLKQGTNEVRDGMETALCSFDLKNMKLYFAGAKRPMWVFHKNGNAYEFEELSASKFPIGGFAEVKEKFFKTYEVQLKRGDILYMFTDGITDQFDMENKKRISTKRVREFINGIVHLSFEEQKSSIHSFISDWKQHSKQTDDILLVALRM